MSEKISYAKLAAIAMCRASKTAQEKAARLKLQIPIWIDGKIVYVDPEKVLTKKCIWFPLLAADFQVMHKEWN